VSNFLGAGLAAGDPVVVIATGARRAAFEAQLQRGGFDVAAARASRQLTLLDAREILSRVLRNGEVDARRFEAELAPLTAGPGTRAYGEMAEVLWSEGRQATALQIEELWNDLQRRRSFVLLCSYPLAPFQDHPALVQRVCRAHTDVVPPPAPGPPASFVRALVEEIGQRKAAERALHELRQRQEERAGLPEPDLQRVVDALPVLVSYVDADQRYRLVSAAYERWIGSRTTIIGKTLAEVLGPEAYRSVAPHAARALSGTAVTFEAELPYRGGARFVEATYVPQAAPDGRIAGFAALVADVTERRTFQRFRDRDATRAARLLRITGAIADAVSADRVFEALVDHVAEAVQASSAALWLVDEGEATARLVRSRGYSAAAEQRFATIALDTAPGIPAAESLYRREPVWISSPTELLARYPELGQAVTPGRAYRVWCLPLLVEGRALGTLGLTLEDSTEPADNERDFLLMVARYASQAIERLRLIEDERKSRAKADDAAARLSLLGQSARRFLETDLDLPSRLRGIVVEMGVQLSSGVGVTLMDDQGLLRTSAIHHPDPEAARMLAALAVTAPLHPGEGVTGRVAASGQSVLIASVDAEEMAARAAPSYRAFLERHPTYALVCAPLRARGQIIGTVTATRTRPGERYTRDDLLLLEQMAEQAAAAIESSRLYQETFDARMRAEQLYRFAQAVVDADRVESVFEAALTAMEAGLGVKQAAVLTFDGAGVMRFRAWRNLSPEYRAAVEGHSPWRSDETNPQPVLVPDVATDAALAPHRAVLAREGIGALAFIPLLNRDRLLGKFMVYHPAPHSFSTAELGTARAIANHLASTIVRFAAVAKLEETIRTNELFAGVLAHDLRNPLGAIINAAQLLRGEAIERPVARILSSGQRMTRMIEQLLDFTRARTGGGIDITPRPTSLADLCAQATGELELTHPDWRIQRRVLGDPTGTWDPDRLLQAISNLVANAGQHGRPAGEIVITIDGRLPAHVTLQVHNDGAIPPALLPDLFSPFRTTRHPHGLGLGLFIVHEIALSHRGHIDVTSTPPTGTTFTLHLPRHPPPRSP
jgi:PAS domain S-box-containing protein